MKWYIPVTLTEYGREVIVEADTKGDAIRKFRAREWEEMTDCNDPRTKLTKVGPARTDPK